MDTHHGERVTVARLRWLLGKATAELGEVRLTELSPEQVCAWRFTVPEGHRFEANRIRHAYLELAPELEPYFVTSRYDDQAGLLQSLIGETRSSPATQPFLAVHGVIAVVDSVVAGATVGIAGLGLGHGRLFGYRWCRPRRVGRRSRCLGEKADRALGELILPLFRRRQAKERPSIDSLVRGPGYLEPRPGPGTNSTSSRRRWLLRFGMSAAITGFLSLFVRASIGGFSLQ